MGRILSLILSAVFLFGCGPSQTARQSEKEQENRHLKQTLGEMANLEGKWAGSITPIGRNITDEEVEEFLKGPKAPVTPAPKPPPNPPPAPRPTVILQILVASILQNDVSRNEVVEIPTLMGVWRATTAEDASIVFTNGLYNAANGHIQLNSATIQLPTSSVTAPTILQLQFDGRDHLTGRLIAPQLIGDVDFRRVQ